MEGRLEITHVDLQHRTDQTVTNGTDVAPGGVKGCLDVRPQFEDQVETHQEVLARGYFELQHINDKGS